MELNAAAVESAAVIDAFAKYANDQPGDALPFYEAEGRLLALWDQLKELKLEIALKEAQKNHSPPPEAHEQTGANVENGLVHNEVLERALKEAEKECLEARATYTLRQSVVEDTLISGPILKAVHSGSNATPTERSLRPVIDRRDILSIAASNLSSILQSTTRNVSTAEADRMMSIKINQDMAPSVFTRAQQMESARNDAIAQSALTEQLAEAQEDASEAKKRWRIMKSVCVAVIVGSGVDWASNAALRLLVLDDEDEDEDENWLQTLGNLAAIENAQN